MDVDRTDSPAGQESFYLRPQSPATKQERSFFSSTPRADSTAAGAQRLSDRAPPSPLATRKVHENSEMPNGIDKVPPHTRGQLNSDSSYSIDVLSGGESECESLRKRRDDTLGRLLRTPASSNGVINNAEYSNIGTGTFDAKHNRRGHADRAFYIAKEMLMTERTYKKDLEVITVWLREELPIELELELCGNPLWAPLESLRGAQDPALRALEARLLSRPDNNNREGNGEAYRTGALMLAYLKEAMPFYLSWVSEHLDSLRRLEEACGVSPTLEQVCREVEQQQRACYLPLGTFLLKPLYRLLHYQQLLTRALEVCSNDDEEYEDLKECLNLLQPVCREIDDILPESLNYSHLCLLHRDIDGLDNLVLPGRQFLRQGCLFKHSNKGPQQRMFFLFSDILVYGSKCSSSQQQFRIHGVIPLSSVQVEPAEYNNSFTLYGGGRAMTLSASTSDERDYWLTELDLAAEEARATPQETPPLSKILSTSISAEELSDGADAVGSALQRSNTLSHVCWHRNTSLSWRHLVSAMENQLSGYLLRKFKNSLGWQKLWVVFASFCLYFYKTCQDDFPLASLPLLGYVVTTPSERDGINKDFVFKLVFKNHVYFFRAESEYTFKRWMEVIGSATTQPLED